MGSEQSVSNVFSALTQNDIQNYVENVTSTDSEIGNYLNNTFEKSLDVVVESLNKTMQNIEVVSGNVSEQVNRMGTGANSSLTVAGKGSVFKHTQINTLRQCVATSVICDITTTLASASDLSFAVADMLDIASTIESVKGIENTTAVDSDAKSKVDAVQESAKTVEKSASGVLGNIASVLNNAVNALASIGSSSDTSNTTTIENVNKLLNSVKNEYHDKYKNISCTDYVTRLAQRSKTSNQVINEIREAISNMNNSLQTNEFLYEQVSILDGGNYDVTQSNLNDQTAELTYTNTTTAITNQLMMMNDAVEKGMKYDLDAITKTLLANGVDLKSEAAADIAAKQKTEDVDKTDNADFSTATVVMIVVIIIGVVIVSVIGLVIKLMYDKNKKEKEKVKQSAEQQSV